MAREKVVARESSVNSLNAQNAVRNSARLNERNLPYYDHRYENPVYNDTGAVFVRRSVYDGRKTNVTFQARSTYTPGGDIRFEVPNSKMATLVNKISDKKDYSISLPKGKAESVTLTYNSSRDEVVYNRTEKSGHYVERKISANAFRNMRTRNR